MVSFKASQARSNYSRIAIFTAVAIALCIVLGVAGNKYKIARQNYILNQKLLGLKVDSPIVKARFRDIQKAPYWFPDELKGSYCQFVSGRSPGSGLYWIVEVDKENRVSKIYEYNFWGFF